MERSHNSKKLKMEDLQGEKRSRDWISELPDEILITILSFLTLKEVASVCFLSKRLKSLWPNIVTLNFDASDVLNKLQGESDDSLIKNKRSWYIGWVNHILELHNCSTLNEFRVCFELDSTSMHDIDSWFRFAISKRVQKLEFNFEEVASRWLEGLRSYSFTKGCYDYVRTPHGLSCIGFLTSLCFRFVQVSGEVLEHFLSHCPLLEKLVVEQSKNLVTLKVASSSPLQLRYLEIRSCYSLENLEISAPNLCSFRYYGQMMALHIENAPNLVHVLIGGNFEDQPAFAFCPLSSYLCQLETLKLEMSFYSMKFPNFPQLTNLRHLVVSVWGAYNDNLFVLTSLIDASPSLNKLSLELNVWSSCYICKYNAESHTGPRIIGKPIPSLKVVEVLGFGGFQVEANFITYLLEHGKMIEKFTINCCHPRWNWKGREQERKYALELKVKAPPTTEFIVI